MASIRERKAARNESFCTALRLALCPSLTVRSFTVLIVVIDIVMFIAELSLHPMSTTEFLAPNSLSMDVLGEKDPRKMKNNL